MTSLAGDDAVDAAPVHDVRLLALPVADYLRLEAHHDAMLREFALLSISAADGGAAAPRRIAELSRELERRFSSMRGGVGGAVRRAAEEGEPSVDVAFTVSREQLEDAEALLKLLEEADEFCRSGAMLTVPTTPALVALRRWLVMDVSAQVRRGAAPSPGPELPTPDPNALLQLVPDTMIAADRAGRLVYASAGSLELLGWPPQELVGLPIEMLIPERLRASHRAGFIRFVETGEIGPASRGVRLPALRRDGTEVDVELTVQPFRTLHGQDLVAASIRAVTSGGADRDRFMGLLESLGGVVWEVDGETLEPVFMSDGAADLLGRPLNELNAGLGPWAEWIDPRDREETLAWRRRAAAPPSHGSALSCDYRVTTDDGGERWIRDRVVAIEEVGGRHILGLSVDITREQRTVRRRDARARVSVALATAASLRDVTPTVIAAVAEGWGWDTGALWSLGASDELRVVRSWITDPERFGAFDEPTHERSFRRGVGLPGRVWETGAPAWVADIRGDENLPRARIALACGLHSCIGLPIFLGDEFIGVLEFFGRAVRRVEPETIEDLQAIAAQIALFIDRRRADDDLLFQKALLEWQSEAALDAMIVVSDDGRVLSYNQRFAEMSDIGADTLTAGDAQQVLDRALQVVAEPAAFAELLAGVRGDGKPRRAELALTDGRFVDCYVASLPYPIGGTYARAWYFRDITDRRQAEDELRTVAETLERSLLPPITPAIPGLEVATRHRYAAGGRDIGGDFYDVFRTGPGWGVVIGDVCGKGAPAASLTGLVRYTTRVAAMGDATPDEVLAVVNEAVLREPGDDRLCTLAYARLQVGSGRVVADVAVGGHPLPLVVRADGTVEPLGRPGTVLGAVSASDATTMTTILARHDALVLYTDGVTEARRGDEFFDVPRLVELLRGLAGAGAEQIAERVLRAALEFQGDEPRDDIAVVTLRVP